MATLPPVPATGLTQLGAVPLCHSLKVLNLSCNQLSSVGELRVLVALEELDVSANQITALGKVLREILHCLSTCLPPPPLSLSLSRSPSLSFPLSCTAALPTDGFEQLEMLQRLDLPGNNVSLSEKQLYIYCIFFLGGGVKFSWFLWLKGKP